MSRNLLHVSKLEDFKVWLDENGIKHRPSKNQSYTNYQVLQVNHPAPHWCAVYERLGMKEHYTVDRRLESLVARFCRENRESKKCD